MKKDRSHVSPSVVSLLKSAFFCAAILVSVRPSAATLNIGSDTTFNSYYYGTINIVASNITVNFNNNWVLSSGDAWSVLVYNQSNVTLQNASSISGADIGIYCENSDHVVIEDINAYGDDWGIYVSNCENCEVNDCFAVAETYDGICFYQGENVVANDCDANYCGRAGFWGASYLIGFFDCTAYANDNYGFASVGSNASYIWYNDALYNGSTGFLDYYTNSSWYFYCTSNNNGAYGYNNYNNGSTNLGDQFCASTASGNGIDDFVNWPCY